MPFCANCGTAVNAVSYAACPACGKPTNGAIPRPVQSTSGSSASVIVIVVVVVVLVGVAFLGIVAAIAIPNLLTAMQRSKQKRTMADIRVVATAVEAYATDHKQYPNAIDVGGLSAELSPTYLRIVPSVDGWGHALHYDAWASQGSVTDSYAIGSGAKDGVFLHQSLRDYLASPGGTTNFNDDIVYSNGSFVQYPEGIQRQ
jgi:type II secretory pathway pseudopilin PulG